MFLFSWDVYGAGYFIYATALGGVWVFASSLCKYSFEMRNNLQNGLCKCFICFSFFLNVLFMSLYDGINIAIALFGQ